MKKPNKIVVVSVTKIESDIIESFVRHSFSFADEILIANNGSNDGAKEILQKLQEEGLPLHVKDLDYQVEFDHAKMMLSLVRDAVADYGADVVLPLDIDEFLVNTENKIPCREILQVLNCDKTYMLQMSNYKLLEPYEDSMSFLLDRDCIRESLDTFRVGKVIVGAELARKESFRLLQGCHEAYWETENGNTGIPYEKVPFLHIAHFHLRSSKRYIAKSVLGWIGMASQYTEYSFVCNYMRKSYERIVNGENNFQSTPAIGEPINLMSFCQRQVMQYGAAAKLDSMAIILREFANLAEAYAEEKAVAQRRTVDLLIPFWGDMNALCISLDAALDQTYPYVQIHILKWMGAVPNGLEELMQEYPSIDFLDCEGMDVDAVADYLSNRVTGDYVQWLLPGSAPEANHIKKLVAVHALQNDYRHKFPFVVASRPKPDGRNLCPYMEIYHGEDVSFLCDRNSLWRRMLVQGEYPVNGMDDVMVSRTFLRARKWLLDCLDENGPRVFSMWRSLLLELPQDELIDGGLGIKEKSGYIHPVSKDEYILHQIEWIETLSKEVSALSEEEMKQALSNMMENYRKILFAYASADKKLMCKYKECIQKFRSDYNVTDFVEKNA